MLGNVKRYSRIYLAYGYTDLRFGIDGLARVVQDHFSLDPFQKGCGEHSEALKTAGITIGKDGTLSLDKNKLKEADVESLEKLFGPSGSFSEKVAFLGDRIADNAGANALSYSSKYNSNGNSYASLGNKYDIWG